MAKKSKCNLKIPTRNDLLKRYGNMIQMASETTESGLWLPSTFYVLNYTLGGGIPYGKILEVAGEESSAKSLIAYNFAYCCQQLGGHVIWVDAEQSWMNSWAEQNGVDPSKVTVVNDTRIEYVSDAVADLAIYLRSQLVNNEPILLVVDSIAAMDCADSIDSKMVDGKAEMGGRAKALYKYFRIRSELFYKLGVTQIYINQLRTALNVGFGKDNTCLHYDTIIPFVDGTSMKIGDIIKNKVSKEVWSYNEELGIFEPKPIVDWVVKSETKRWIQFKTEGLYPEDTSNIFTCTYTHHCLTNHGWKKAEDITFDDKLITKTKKVNSVGQVEYIGGEVSILSIDREFNEDDPRFDIPQKRLKYDITIPDNHNFLAGSVEHGVVVHNTTTGGAALKFYASIRIATYAGKSITTKYKGKERRAGKLVTIRVLKNKVAPPRPTISKTPVYFNPKYHEVGFVRCAGLDDVLLENDIIEKSSGGVFKFKGKTLCRGEENFYNLLEEDDTTRRKLLRAVEINTIGTTKKLVEKIEKNLFPIDGDIEYASQNDDDEYEEYYDEEDEN